MPIARNVNRFRNTQISLKYTLHGPENGPVVVFIPGLGSQLVHLQYNSLVGPLTDRGFRVLRIENRDSGLSTILDGYETSEESQSVGKGIVNSIVSPANATESPLFFDPTKPVEQQICPELFQHGIHPHLINQNQKGTNIKTNQNQNNGNDDNNNNNNNNLNVLPPSPPSSEQSANSQNNSNTTPNLLPLGPDYVIYPGFQPRELVFNTILQQRQELLTKLHQKHHHETPTTPSSQSPTTASTTTTTSRSQQGENVSSVPSLVIATEEADNNTSENSSNLPSDNNNNNNNNQDIEPQSPRIQHDLYQDLTTTQRAPIAQLFEKYFYLKEGNFISKSYNSLYCLSELAVDAILVINSLNIDKFSLVGTSMGGMIAMFMCALVPNRIVSFATIMSGTGTSLYNPKLWFLVRNLVFRRRPDAPPFPTLVNNSQDNTLDQQLSPTSPVSSTSPVSPTSPSFDPETTDVLTLNVSPSTQQVIKQYKQKLKKYHKNRKLFKAYVNFLVETNASVGAPHIDPVTGATKTYNNGRSVLEHVSRWVQRAPAAKGAQRQASAITSTPARDPLLFWITQHIPTMYTHGTDDELVPVANTHHSYDIAKAALKYVGCSVDNDNVDAKNSIETAVISQTAIAQDESTLTTSEPLTTTTTTTPNTIKTDVDTTNVTADDDTAEKTTTNNDDNKLVNPITSPLLNEKTYTIGENSNATVSRVVGYNRFTKTYIQHRKLLIQGAKHEINDSFAQIFVPQLIHHLEQAHNGISRSALPIQLEDIEAVPTDVQFHDEDLLYGVEDDELVYYDPNAEPPAPPAGFALVLKKDEYILVALDKVKSSQNVVASTPLPFLDEQGIVTKDVQSPVLTNNNNCDDQDNLDGRQSHSFSLISTPSQEINSTQFNNTQPETTPADNNNNDQSHESSSWLSKLKGKFRGSKSPSSPQSPQSPQTEQPQDDNTTNNIDPVSSTSIQSSKNAPSSISTANTANNTNLELSTSRKPSWQRQSSLSHQDLENLQAVQQPQYGGDEEAV